LEEAWFTLNGNVCSQNNTYWCSKKNPHHSWTSLARCAASACRIIWHMRLFFEKAINSYHCVQLTGTIFQWINKRTTNVVTSSWTLPQPTQHTSWWQPQKTYSANGWLAEYSLLDLHIWIHGIIICEDNDRQLYVNNPHPFQDLEDHVQRETANNSTQQLCCVSIHFRR
jgi:hypothetical protein